MQVDGAGQGADQVVDVGAQEQQELQGEPDQGRERQRQADAGDEGRWTARRTGQGGDHRQRADDQEVGQHAGEHGQVALLPGDDDQAVHHRLEDDEVHPVADADPGGDAEPARCEDMEDLVDQDQRDLSEGNGELDDEQVVGEEHMVGVGEQTRIADHARDGDPHEDGGEQPAQRGEEELAETLEAEPLRFRCFEGARRRGSPARPGCRRSRRGRRARRTSPRTSGPPPAEGPGSAVPAGLRRPVGARHRSRPGRSRRRRRHPRGGR